jgi:hypothetical protein
MTATPTIPTRPATEIRISSHAVDQYRARVDRTLDKGQARVALFHVWLMGRDATDWELARLRRDQDAEVTYRLAETCYGVIVMPIRQGVMTTCWAVQP